MKEKKSKQYIIDKTITITLLVLYIIIQICCFLFERDIWWFLTDSKNPKMLGFGWTLLISLGVTVLYITIFYLRLTHVSKIFVAKCDPMQFYERYDGLFLKLNKDVKIQNKLTCNFLAGNWKTTREQCFDVLTHSKNIPHIMTAYSVMAQIYLVEGDILNITALRDSVKPFTNDPKFGHGFKNIFETADMYYEYMMGNAENMVKKYTKMLEQAKQVVNKYVIKFYLAMALAHNGNADKAIKLFEEIIKGANKLFVVESSKQILLSLISI